MFVKKQSRKKKEQKAWKILVLFNFILVFV